ncbi:MAG: Maf family protein [Vicinamibacterales bacterium]
MTRLLILASASPRRAELLTSAGFGFLVSPAEVDETPHAEEAASDYVIRVARDKARHIASDRTGTGAVVLAADTAVVTESRIMGKPRNDEDAANMLATLSGAVHQVLTGVVVRTDTRELVELVATRVHFLPMSSAEVSWYVSTGEPRGKAGAYAIQGHAARFIDWIDGSWSNVVGLPLSTVNRMLKEVGVVD